MARRRKDSGLSAGFGHFDELGTNYRRFRYPDGHGHELSEYHHCAWEESKRRRDELFADYIAKKRGTTYWGESGGVSRKRKKLARITCGEIWRDDVLPDYLSRVKPNSMRMIRTTWRHLEKDWADVPVGDVIGADLERWMAENINRSTAAHVVMVMRAITNRAVAMGALPTNPLDYDIKLPPAKKTEPRAMVNDSDPYIAAVRHDPCLLGGVLLMLAGGCRVGEALAVRADSVRQDGNRVLFDVVDQATEKGHLAGSLKNKYSARTASIEGEYGTMLLELAHAALARGETYVCDRGTGKPVAIYNFREHFYRALDTAGVGRVTLQSLRNAWSTRMINGRADLTAVNRSMGHAADSHVLVTNYFNTALADAPVLNASWDNPSKSVQND